MSHIYCVGGASRSGKTHIMQQFLSAHPVQAISTDAFRYTLKRLPNARHQLPDLFAGDPYEHRPPAAVDKATAQRYIEAQNRESSAVWPAIASYIEANQRDGIDTLVEGVAVLPQYVAQLPGTVHAVFIGNQSPRHWLDMQHYAQANPRDGLNRRHLTSDAEFQNLARLYQAFSVMIEAEAKKYGFAYIEMSAPSFDAGVRTAVDHLYRQPSGRPNLDGQI